MFVGGQAAVGLGFTAARANLEGLARSAALLHVAQQAYRTGAASLARPDPPLISPGLPELTRIRARSVTAPAMSFRLALRWEAEGRGDAPEPVLDADITLAPAGDGITALVLAGVYRAHGRLRDAALHPVLLEQAASATASGFISSLAQRLARPGSEAAPGTRLIY
jgi:hypothetical protein